MLTQNWALEIFSISPHVTFQHIKGKDNILTDSLSYLQCLGLYEKSHPEKPGEEYSVTIFDEGETIQEHVQPEYVSTTNADMVTLVTNSNNEESVSDKHTFQVGGDIYEEDLAFIPKPHIQYTPHQIKLLQMKHPSLAIIMNKLQKNTHPHKPLPSTYFLNTNGVLYHCVREGFQSFEAVVVPKKLYQLVLTTCHDLMGTQWHNTIVWVHKKILLLAEIKARLYQTHASMQRMSTHFFERIMLCRSEPMNSKAANVFHCPWTYEVNILKWKMVTTTP